MKDSIMDEIKWRESELPLWESDRFLERYKAVVRMNLRRRFLSGMIVYGPLLLLPRRIGDPVLNFLHKIVESSRCLKSGLFLR